jgi:membrane protease YdiL (CAAX protease family)
MLGTHRRALAEELLIVLSLSLLPSAVDSLFSLLTAPLAGVSTFLYSAAPFVQQVADIVFSLAPVALVVHLARRSGESLAPFGLRSDAPGRDAAAGAGLAAIVAVTGLVIYLAAIRLKVNRFVVPVPPLHHWWTIPVLALGAAQAGLLEEVIVAGYMIRRLRQLGWAPAAAVAASALLRAGYHLYQGWGGFAGNLALGLFFGAVFVRWRRTWPLIVAHFLVDLLAGLGYIVFMGHCFFGACIR